MVSLSGRVLVKGFVDFGFVISDFGYRISGLGIFDIGYRTWNLGFVTTAVSGPLSSVLYAQGFGISEFGTWNLVLGIWDGVAAQPSTRSMEMTSRKAHTASVESEAF